MTRTNDRCRKEGHDTLRGLRACVASDIVRYLTKSPDNIARGDTLKTRVSAFLTPELICVFLYRIAHYFYVSGWRRMGALVTRTNSLLHRATITPQSCIGAGCRIPHPSNIAFHGIAGRGLTMYSNAICCAREPVFDGPAELGPQLGDNVLIGGHAVVIGPVSVGDDVKIAFSVTVDKDIAPGSLVVSKAQRVTMKSIKQNDMMYRESHAS